MHSAALHDRALGLMRAERNGEARELLRAAAAALPPGSDPRLLGSILYNLGGAEYRLGDPGEAARHFRAAIGCYPGSMYPYAALKGLARQRKDWPLYWRACLLYWRNAPAILRDRYAHHMSRP